MAEAKNVNTQDVLELPMWGDIRKVCIPVLVKGVGSSSMKNHCYFSEFLTAAAAVAATTAAVPAVAAAAATSVLLLLLLLCQDCVVFFPTESYCSWDQYLWENRRQGMKDGAWARKTVVEL